MNKKETGIKENLSSSECSGASCTCNVFIDMFLELKNKYPGFSVEFYFASLTYALKEAEAILKLEEKTE